ncbi:MULTISPECIES: hypothetical protein [unclassified Kaistella]|uniref:hypothetical protein n=1 Tax=unclassified Kaistella TaxID=2762626 RepID=UPI0027350B8B|nr:MULTISPECIES: hypothetical protein [unclassified Kaistella]MDP2453292.1 hypothetical protein [Kaistella sp. SH11-4b]MDP2456349.1 hypothetical protein [Kaistella sp. SH40-3]MDP2459105.1 hypothetical protein [Kaistella sp. SH19-2b]
MKLLFTSFSFLIFNLAIAQYKQQPRIQKRDFPAGIYMTMDDVISKKPSSTEEITLKISEEFDFIKYLPEQAFFYFKANDKKVKTPLALSYKGEMYFQTYRKYTNKKDKGYDPDEYSRFCKVTSYGRFLYFEESMRGLWSKALLGNLNSATYSMAGNIKGMVLDVENKELNILRNCEDLNDFLKQHQISEIECNSDQLTIGDLRVIIDEINKPEEL